MSDRYFTFCATSSLPDSDDHLSGPLSSKRARLVEKPVEMMTTLWSFCLLSTRL